MPVKVPLSVVVITKNEEANLDECLKSVSGWADEVIIVDDESTDKTIEVARRFTDRIFIRKIDIEGRHRNWAYSQAKNTWVLSLDADERATPELKEEIALVLSESPKENGFIIPRRNYIGDYWVRYGGWYPSPQLKLFRQDKFRYEEVNACPRAFMEEPCGHLKQDLLHYSYRDFDDFFDKLNNRTRREAQKWLNQNKPMTFARFFYRSIDRFIRTYITKQGYRDGVIGCVVAIYASLYQFISYLKYKELVERRQDK